jgi:8-oxo-dGTP diphosphatase
VSYSYEYPRPMVSVDCVIFGLDDDSLKLLLIKRGGDPFKGKWALPGGFVEMDESLDDAARRELQEETGLTRLYLEQLYTFGAPNRDPRGRVITVAYWALTRVLAQPIRADSDAAQAAWFALSDLPRLAFDHADIIDAAVQRLRAKVRYQPVGFHLLPPRFTLSQLQSLYETILEQKLDKRNFRKRILDMEILQSLDEVQKDVAHRAAQLYKFDQAAYERLTAQGLNFDL